MRASLVLALMALCACSRPPRGPVVFFQDHDGAVDLLMNPAPVLLTSGGSFAGNPGAARKANGDCFLVVRDGGNSVWLNYWTQADWKFRGWRGADALAGRDPAAAVIGTDRALFALIDPQGAFWTGVSDSQGRVTDWQTLNGDFGGNPAIAACPSGAVHLLANDRYNRTWRRIVDGSAKPQGDWERLDHIYERDPSVACVADTVFGATVRRGVGAGVFALRAGQPLAWYGADAESAGPPQLAVTAKHVYLLVVDSQARARLNRFPLEAPGQWEGWKQVEEGVAEVKAAVWKDELVVFLRGVSNNVAWWREGRATPKQVIHGSILRGSLIPAF